MTVVHINSITANSDVADGNGSLWYVMSMAGWDSPTIRQVTSPIPSKHGMVTAEGLYGARNIVVEGVCQAVSEAAFFASKYYLVSQTNFLKRTTFVFSVEEEITRTLNVIRSGELRMAHVGVNTFSFQLPLRANDPFKTGATGAL